MPADFAASTFAARSSKNTIASGDETFARSIATLYMSGCGLHNPTWCDEIANSKSSMILSSFVLRSQCSSFELLNAASR